MRQEYGTKSLWLSTVLLSDFPDKKQLSSNLKTDVCIVGAGITGLTTAYLLLKSGHKVVVIDDGDIGSGETGRTTAHISDAIDDWFHKTEETFGTDGARLIYESHRDAIQKIDSIVKKEKIDCEFEKRHGYLFIRKSEKESYDKEYESAKRLGAKVTRVNKKPLEAFKDYYCLKFAEQAQFNSMKYLSGLAKCITDMGGEIYTRTHVDSIEENEKITVKAGPYTVICRDAVVATNSPVSNTVIMHLKQTPYRTYVVAYEVEEGYLPNGLFWDDEENYHYIRMHKTNDKYYLIIGGEDHVTGQDDKPEKHFENLDIWSHLHFPDLPAPKYKWSGQVIEPADGMSYVGLDPEFTGHVYIATGDSGMGITHGTFSAMIIDDLINNKENPWAEIYSPARLKWDAVSNYVKEGFATFAGYAKFLTGGDVSDEYEIKPGEGAVMNDGLNKIAVYKDEKNIIHKFSALCTHLNCVLSFNSLEKTWDCPCHGSRFTALGKVVNGPAIEDMRKME